MISEMFPYIFVKKVPLTNWFFSENSCDKKPSRYEKTVNPGFEWNFHAAPVWFKKELEPISIEDDQKVYLKLWFGGETLIFVDGKPYGEINEHHRMLNITPLADGKTHLIEAQTVPRGLFGKPEHPIFSEAYLLVIDEKIKEVLKTLELTIKTAETIDDEVLSRKLIRLTENFLSKIWIPRDTQTYLKASQEDPGIKMEIQNVWSSPDFGEFTGMKLPNDLKRNLIEEFEKFKIELEKVKRNGPGYGTVHLVGHAHIDYAWLWPVEETKRKILRTFANSVLLSRLYPEFVYTQSSAQMYEDLKKNSPELFEEVKKLVKDGRWEPVGGMWVEADCNVPSVESLVRQFYYGQKFFEKEFGKKSKVCWLPDVFGFSWILPQILKGVGIDYFVTTKLNWNDTNEFPYDICRWRGIDGSEVLYYSFKNPNEGYNGKIDPDTVYKTWKNFRQKDLLDSVLLSFGYGDGGGGPTEDMLENYRIMKKIPGIPRLEIGSVEEFFEKTNLTEELPIWDGELYLELHRGTYTSQSRTKRLHKESEDALYKAELISSLTNKDFSEEIDELWKILLRNEFHDILPGSSIKEVYETTEKELSYVEKRANTIVEESLKILSDGDKKTLTLLNVSSFPRKCYFFTNEKLNLSSEIGPVLRQATHDGRYVYFLDFELEPFSKIELKVQDEESHEKMPKRNDLSMENEYLKVSVNPDGTIQIYDKEADRYAFEDRGNYLKLHKNIPPHWDNWDIAEGVEKTGYPLKAKKIEKIEFGPVREVIRVEYEAEGSKIFQYYVLYRKSKRLDIETKIDWHTRRALLRVYFPINVLSRIAKFDISGGFIERPTHKNTKFEQARFEVPGHRWMDLSQTDFGVSTLNDGKYGYSVQENMVGLSLIKAGIFPDFLSDEGQHEFVYSVYPHLGNDLRGTIKEAEELNKPLLVHFGKLDIPSPLLEIKPRSFKLTSFRKANGKFIVRLVEIFGTAGKLSIKLPWNKRIYLTDLLEEKREDVHFPMNYRPFKIYTFIAE
ncbi:alpha-mannosidase [Thermotoga sp. KOL6]|uniref:alpha-mannosidase n=1 Tax=Thermotoga sp. KOL6 TaxID=126741 RepID=UPI000CB54E60|nr:alpha-mannosidase [Thermotoga sp. KOL6]